MDKTIADLTAWCQDISRYHTPAWDELPDLGLYMDQVITYLERHTALFSAEEDKLITPAMINNYVKSEIVPRPNQKKYSREHLAFLLVITTLKQILPIPDISRILESQALESNLAELFNRLGHIQDEALEAVSERIAQLVDSKDTGLAREMLGMMVLKLTFEANANILAAKKMLRLLDAGHKEAAEDNQKSREKKDREKSREKKKKAEPAPKEDQAESASE
jgi:DNA-binding transcriptional MerR regulator